MQREVPADSGYIPLSGGGKPQNTPLEEKQRAGSLGEYTLSGARNRLAVGFIGDYPNSPGMRGIEEKLHERLVVAMNAQ